MKWIAKQVLLGLFFGSSVFANTSIGLEECFQSAVKVSETVANQGQQVVQAEERVSQAKGNFLPNVSGNATYFIQQAPSDEVARSFFPTTQPNVKLSINQPVFRGFREFAALRQAKRTVEAEGHSRDLALIQLYSDVTQNFYALLGYEQEIANLKNQLQLYQDRIDELNQRKRTGQSSASEAITAQANQAMVQAQLKQVTRDYRATWEVFSYLTGLPSESPLAHTSPFVRDEKPLSFYLTTLDNRPDIKAAKERLAAAEDGVSVAKGGHLPTVDFQGNYYLARPVGVFSDIKWDVQATLNVPLFSGGIIRSQIHQASSQQLQAELVLSRTRRLAEQEIRTLYDNYHSDLEQLVALEASKELNEKNYQVLKKDYSKGLTRNLDVLQALTQFQESKRALDRTRWNVQATWIRLQVLSTVQTLSVVRN
jgi:outer membrane protein